jgi:hypothetical protein
MLKKEPNKTKIYKVSILAIKMQLRKYLLTILTPLLLSTISPREITAQERVDVPLRIEVMRENETGPHVQRLFHDNCTSGDTLHTRVSIYPGENTLFSTDAPDNFHIEVSEDGSEIYSRGILKLPFEFNYIATTPGRNESETDVSEFTKVYVTPDRKFKCAVDILTDQQNYLNVSLSRDYVDSTFSWLFPNGLEEIVYEMDRNRSPDTTNFWLDNNLNIEINNPEFNKANVEQRSPIGDEIREVLYDFATDSRNLFFGYILRVTPVDSLENELNQDYKSLFKNQLENYKGSSTNTTLSNGELRLVASPPETLEIARYTNKNPNIGYGSGANYKRLQVRLLNTTGKPIFDYITNTSNNIRLTLDEIISRGDTLDYFYDLEAYGDLGGEDVTLIYSTEEVGIEERKTSASIPKRFYINHPYPNPFSETTTISYNISDSAHVSTKIYDLRGKLIKSLEDGIKAPGEYKIVWDGTNQHGEISSTGIYLPTVFVEELNGDYRGRRTVKSIFVK